VFPRTKIPTKHVRSNEREQFKNTAKHWQIVGHGGEYEAFGATQGISGVGAEWLLVEDPYPSREKAESTAYRDQVNEWYDDDLRPRRESTLSTDQDLSSILIIHTRWHQNDLIGHVMSKAKEHEETDDYVWLNFPGIRMDGQSVDLEFAGQSQLQRRQILEAFDAKGIPVDYDHETLVDPREYGEALWPDRRGAGDYVAERKTNTRKFWSLDQGQPTPPGGAIFEREWFESDDPDTDLRRWDYLPGSGEYIWTMDPKHGSKEPESSEVVVQLWYRPEDQASAYFVAERRGRWSEPETEEHLLELADDPLWARADAKYIEPEGDGQAIIDNLQSDIPGLQAIDTDKVRRGKKARARSIARYVKSGQVLLPPTKVYDDAPSLVDQLIKFPGAEHDDRVDCFCYAADYLLRDRDDDTDGGSYLDQYPDARDALR
jgi:predicted phage terminase large subunit-like protein